MLATVSGDLKKLDKSFPKCLAAFVMLNQPSSRNGELEIQRLAACPEMHIIGTWKTSNSSY